MRRTGHLMAWTFVLAVAALSAGCKSAWVSSGLIYRDQQGDYAKAEEMFKRALWYNETEAVAHFELAYTLAYRAENDHLANGEVDSARIKIKEAHEHYLRAAELDPGSYRYNQDAEDEIDREPAEAGIASMYARMYNRGVQLMGSERYDEAITHFELAALADPRGKAGFDARLTAAKLEFNASQNDEAIVREVLAELETLKVAEEWEDAAGLRADLTETTAQVYRALGDDEKASKLYEELLASSPDNVPLMRNVAAIRNTNLDHSGAAALYRRALEVALGKPDEFDNEDYFALAIQSLSAFRTGEMYPEVIEMADQAQRYANTNTQRSLIARSKARAYFELEQYDNAVATIEPVVVDGGLDPNSLEAWQLYYLSLSRVGRDQEAVQARERYTALRDSAGR